MADAAPPSGPDFALGVDLADIPLGGMLAGRVGEEPVILARVEGELVAVGGRCTHYGGPLGEGLRVGDTVRCPWHHACFSLRSGEALGAPAIDPLDRWKVEIKGKRVLVRSKLKQQKGPFRTVRGRHPRRIVIVGGGAAGFAAAEMLRRLDYKGALTLLSADTDAPYDRPNLSKDYLAGTAPEEWMPLRPKSFYSEQRIDLRLGVTASAIDPAARRITLQDGKRLEWDTLLLATGSEANSLQAPHPAPNTFTLRSFADCRVIIEKAKTAHHVAIVGASFIGLELAAALRIRGLEVHVIAPDAVPMQKALGLELGGLVRALHTEKGVRFHLGRSVTGFHDGRLSLDNGESIDADLVLLGIGVKPRVELARAAGLAVEGGVIVDDRLRTSAPGIWAAGDIAAFPDPVTGERIRVEHWVAAERQGQTAAANMLGADVRFDSIPFFWSRHYDTEIRYSGHVGAWDSTELDGSLEAQDCEVRYLKGGRVAAVATLGRDRANLQREAGWEAEAGKR
jgi:NADPH-dependent 2,4-dienoyl-CoA reductase/sulfur reductase-like enzyme/nitrite reductase/ring-hydroxylating ferredoxin subunit